MLTFAFDTAVPFGLNTRQHNAWVMQAGGLELMREFYKDYNVTSFLMSHTGAQMGGWYRKEIKTPDDLKGLKIRIGGFAGQVISKLGAVPQQIAGGDIYPALERGAISFRLAALGQVDAVVEAGQLGVLRELRLPSASAPLALLGEGTLEAGAVDGDAVLGGELGRQQPGDRVVVLPGRVHRRQGHEALEAPGQAAGMAVDVGGGSHAGRG